MFRFILHYYVILARKNLMYTGKQENLMLLKLQKFLVLILKAALYVLINQNHPKALDHVGNYLIPPFFKLDS